MELPEACEWTLFNTLFKALIKDLFEWVNNERKHFEDAFLTTSTCQWEFEYSFS